jgi:hypothetical protein
MYRKQFYASFHTKIHSKNLIYFVRLRALSNKRVISV